MKSFLKRFWKYRPPLFCAIIFCYIVAAIYVAIKEIWFGLVVEFWYNLTRTCRNIFSDIVGSWAVCESVWEFNKTGKNE